MKMARSACGTPKPITSATTLLLEAEALALDGADHAHSQPLRNSSSAWSFVLWQWQDQGRYFMCVHDMFNACGAHEVNNRRPGASALHEDLDPAGQSDQLKLCRHLRSKRSDHRPCRSTVIAGHVAQPFKMQGMA